MSGGRWNYQNDNLAYELFHWMCPDYGEAGFSQSMSARKINPMEDKQISELCWDMLCLIHSCDWYKSGDICEDTYEKDIKYFKNKWLKPTSQELAKREIDKSLSEAKEEIYKSLGVEDDCEDENSE